MRYLIVPCTLLLLLAAPARSFGQRTFQGQIDYLLTSRDSTLMIDIRAWFRKDKILFTLHKTRTPQGMEGDDERIILNFRDGFIERIKEKDRRVDREPLTGAGAKRDLPPLKRTEDTLSLIGFLCHQYTSGELVKEEIKDSMKVELRARAGIWFADELLFPVPDSMKT